MDVYTNSGYGELSHIIEHNMKSLNSTNVRLDSFSMELPSFYAISERNIPRYD